MNTRGLDMKKLSKKNPYALSHFRTLELKYFCLQYNEWIKEVDAINLYLKDDDPTGECAIKLKSLHDDIDLVNLSCRLAGDIDGVLLEGVTCGRSYDILEARRGVLPWSRKAYYDCYRRFMYILSCKKQGL